MKRDRIFELIKKERDAEFLYENFSSLREPRKKIRPHLGNFLHLKFSAIHMLSLLYYHPLAKYEFYRLGKLHGYISLLKSKKSLFKNKFWNLSPKEIENQQKDYWKEKKFGILHLAQIDKKKKVLIYEVKETPSSLLSNFNQKGCFFLSGLLSGQLEVLSGHPCNGIEVKCVAEGHPFCKFEISPKMEKRLEFPSLNKDNLKLTLDKLSDSLFPLSNLEKEVKRKELGDSLFLSLNQSLNYTLSRSQGYAVLSKWAGKKLGEKIIQKSGKNSLSPALNLLKELFLKLKIGILTYELDPQRIMIKLEESVFSSGVKNSEIKLESFIEGIIVGSFKQATHLDWVVKETKHGKGNTSHHEFVCRTKDTPLLQKLLLGG